MLNSVADADGENGTITRLCRRRRSTRSARKQRSRVPSPIPRSSHPLRRGGSPDSDRTVNHRSGDALFAPAAVNCSWLPR